jgi:hypothetical protein
LFVRILLNGGELQRLMRYRPWPARHGASLAVLLGALLAAVLGGHAAQAQSDAAWRDIESRIQYGYYTEDAAALRKLTETVGTDESHDKLHAYYAGLLAWRQAQLAAHGAAAADASARQLVQRCVSAADAALSVESEFAEALALRAACLGTPVDSGGGHAPFGARRAHKDLERALALAGRNPRILLVDAMNDYQVSPDKGGRERALPKLRKAVEAFEAERHDTEHLPGWGAAEAWWLLASGLLEHGDPVAARDADEHALLLAPQFAQARRLMTKITSG